jgi:LmbE family N-acetylglucosaminyl deacetylase
VLTFPPDGAYGHPDHIAICQFTTAAVIAAADPEHVTNPGAPPHAVSKLYYFVTSPARWEAYQHIFKRLVSTVDGVERIAHAWPEWEITTRIDTSSPWEIAWRGFLPRLADRRVRSSKTLDSGIAARSGGRGSSTVRSAR